MRHSARNLKLYRLDVFKIGDRVRFPCGCIAQITSAVGEYGSYFLIVNVEQRCSDKFICKVITVMDPNMLASPHDPFLEALHETFTDAA